MTHDQTKIACKCGFKLAKEILKSIPIVGIVFKIAFIIYDLTNDIKSI